MDKLPTEIEKPRREKISAEERFLRRLKEVPAIPPSEMNRRLENLGYKGQDPSRIAACLMAYRHVRRIQRIYLEGRDRKEVFPKTNYLFMGPTGCGKTYLIELLFREVLQLPAVVVDITSFSETGYVGQDTNGVLTRLLHMSDNDLRWASIGIICLDEFDKLASGSNNAVFAGAGTTKDVTGMGVQRELLKMMECSDIVVPLELGHSSMGQYMIMSTADIGFVACGAFSGFHEVVRQHGAEAAIGFGREAVTYDRGKDVGRAFTQSQVDTIAHFYSYGFLPELIARFTRIVPFDSLSAETLKDILRADVLARMTVEFADEGLELKVDEEVLDSIVDDALRARTGARGLGAHLTSVLEKVAYDNFGKGLDGRVAVRLSDGKIEAESEISKK